MLGSNLTRLSNSIRLQQLREENSELRTRLADLEEASRLEAENHSLQERIDRFEGGSHRLPLLPPGFRPGHGA